MRGDPCEGPSITLWQLSLSIVSWYPDNNKVPNEAWDKWWFEKGGKAVLKEVGNHRSTVTFHMKKAYHGELQVGGQVLVQCLLEM